MFLVCFILILAVLSTPVNAAGIGVSPPMIFLENESVNQTLWIINSNNESFDFEVSSTNNFLDFSSDNGKLPKLGKKSISVTLNKKQGFDNKTYEDIILISISKNKNSVKNSIGVKAKLNITKKINPIEFYFINGSLDNGYSNITANASLKDTKQNLITGMSVFFNTKVKNNPIINVILVGVLIFLLYLFIKEPDVENNKNLIRKK